MAFSANWNSTANVCRDLQGLCREIECGDYNPCNFWSKLKKKCGLFIFTLRFFKFPYHFCVDFRRTCNPRDNYRVCFATRGSPALFMGGKFAVCGSSTLCQFSSLHNCGHVNLYFNVLSLNSGPNKAWKTIKTII